MKVILACCLAVVVAIHSWGQQSDLDEVKDLLQRQAACWNEADIDCFMRYYWNSEEMRFVGKSGITLGWQQVKDRYKKNYSTADLMGKLIFDVKSAEMIGKKQIMVVGAWNLVRSEETLGGYFTLIWKKIDKRWLIVFDHTS